MENCSQYFKVLQHEQSSLFLTATPWMLQTGTFLLLDPPHIWKGVDRTTCKTVSEKWVEQFHFLFGAEYFSLLHKAGHAECIVMTACDHDFLFSIAITRDSLRILIRWDFFFFVSRHRERRILCLPSAYECSSTGSSCYEMKRTKKKMHLCLKLGSSPMVRVTVWLTGIFPRETLNDHREAIIGACEVGGTPARDWRQRSCQAEPFHKSWSTLRGWHGNRWEWKMGEPLL